MKKIIIRNSDNQAKSNYCFYYEKMICNGDFTNTILIQFTNY